MICLLLKGHGADKEVAGQSLSNDLPSPVARTAGSRQSFYATSYPAETP